MQEWVSLCLWHLSWPEGHGIAAPGKAVCGPGDKGPVVKGRIGLCSCM